MATLQDEWIIICSFMNVRSLLNFQLACRDFYRIGSCDIIWKSIYQYYWKSWSSDLHPNQNIKFGLCGHLSIINKEMPTENYKYHVMGVYELQYLRTDGKIKFQQYESILKKPLDEMHSKVTHMKISILGEGNGVTSLLMRLKLGAFPQAALNIGSLPAMETFRHETVIEGRKFSIDFIDLSDIGYSRLMPLLLFGCDLFVPTFSLNNAHSSFERVEIKWIPTIEHYMCNAPIIILGTKLDEKSNTHVITEKKLSQQSNCITYYEISALTADDDQMNQFVELCVKSVLMTHRPIITSENSFATFGKPKKCFLQ